MRPAARIFDKEKSQDKLYLSIFNPLPSLRVLLRPDSALVVVSISILYMLSTCLQASLSSLFIEIYQLNQIEAGLIYLPFGIGCAITALLTGVFRIAHDHIFSLIASREKVGQRLQKDREEIQVSCR